MADGLLNTGLTATVDDETKALWFCNVGDWLFLLKLGVVYELIPLFCELDIALSGIDEVLRDCGEKSLGTMEVVSKLLVVMLLGDCPTVPFVIVSGTADDVELE